MAREKKSKHLFAFCSLFDEPFVLENDDNQELQNFIAVQLDSINAGLESYQ